MKRKKFYKLLLLTMVMFFGLMSLINTKQVKALVETTTYVWSASDISGGDGTQWLYTTTAKALTAIEEQDGLYYVYVKEGQGYISPRASANDRITLTSVTGGYTLDYYFDDYYISYGTSLGGFYKFNFFNNPLYTAETDTTIKITIVSSNVVGNYSVLANLNSLVQGFFNSNEYFQQFIAYFGNLYYNQGYNQALIDNNNDYITIFNNAVNWAKEEIYNNGIGNLPLPDGTGFYDETLSYDYLLGHTAGYDYAESIIPQNIYDNGIEIYSGFNAMLSHDFIAGVAMDDAYAYNQGFIDGGNDSFMSNLETWIVPAIIIVLIGGFFVTVASHRMSGRD